VNTQFVGFCRAPDFVSVVFAYSLSFGLKIRVYWQKIHRLKWGEAGILAFLLLEFGEV
jgi:hypothetical protein